MAGEGVRRSEAVGDRRRPVADRVGVPVGGASLAAGTEPVGGLAGASASGCCGVRGVSGMKTGAVRRVTGGGEEVKRSEAVGERVGPVGGLVAGEAGAAPVVAEGRVSGWVPPNAGGSGPVEGCDEVGGAASCEVGGRAALVIGGSAEVGGRAGGTGICEVGGRGVPPGGAREPGAGRVDMPDNGGSGSVVGREPCEVRNVGALEKTGGAVALPEGVTAVWGGVGGRGGAGWVVRCSWTVGGREK